MSPDLQLVHETDKASAMSAGGATRNRLGDDPTRLDRETGGLDFGDLVFSCLSGRRDADIGEGARHELNSSKMDVRNVDPVRN